MGLWLPYQKPIRGTRLNLTHPLSAGVKSAYLFNECSSVPYELLSNSPSTFDNAADWNGGGVGFYSADDCMSSSIEFQSQERCCFVFNFIGDAIPTSHARFIAASPDDSYFKIARHDNNELLLVDINTVRTGNIGIPNLWDGNPHQLAVNWDVFSGFVEVFVDGVFLSKHEGNLGSAITHTSLLIGNREDRQRWLGGTIFSVFEYGRTISHDEVAWLYREPYAMLKKSTENKNYFFFDLPEIEYFSITFVDTGEFEWHSTAEFIWGTPGLTIPENVAVVVDSLSQATVTWSLVADADAYMVEAQVSAVGAVPENVSVVLDSNTQATITWDENAALVRVQVRARVRAGITIV